MDLFDIACYLGTDLATCSCTQEGKKVYLWFSRSYSTDFSHLLIFDLMTPFSQETGVREKVLDGLNREAETDTCALLTLRITRSLMTAQLCIRGLCSLLCGDLN